jgi:catechol 2,3-dioxygenase-like lactoylglutathione lyase family enzyme
MRTILAPEFRRTARLCAVAFAAAAALAAGGLALGQSSGAPTIRPMLWQAGMKRSDIGEVNVFRRFSSDRVDAMREFYGEVLGLPVLPSTALGGNAMIRYPVGASEVKLFPVMPSEPRPAKSAAVGAAAGMRLLTFFYKDQAELAQRFARHGIEPPIFKSPSSHRGATAAALAQDPDGEWVELVIVPNASPAELARFEIGVNVADLDASRGFYRDLLGLEERAPVRDELLGTTKHGYTHRDTTINLFSFGAGLPNASQTGGMQYIVWSASAVNDVAQARRATIDRPLSNPGQMRTIWLFDPDGVSNYFAEFAGNDNTLPR